MLCDNLKQFRNKKGFSQAELAIRLHIVRQTVSKWEKGLSVPDAEMLIRISDELEVPVADLLGQAPPPAEENELKTLAARLELLNEQFARECERRRKIRRIIFIVLGILGVLLLLHQLADLFFCHAAIQDLLAQEAIIGGYDGPTDIFISSVSLNALGWIAGTIALFLSIIGLFATRKS